MQKISTHIQAVVTNRRTYVLYENMQLNTIIFRRKIYGIYKEMFHNNQNIEPHRLTISNQSFHVVSP